MDRKVDEARIKYSLMRRSKGSNFASLREDYCLFNFGSILIFYLI